METRAQVIRRWRRTLLLIACIWGIGLAAGAGWLYHKIEDHRHWYREVEHQILRLAAKKPDGVTAEQWAACITWMWNLHSNYGWESDFPEERREPFLREFTQHVDGPGSFDTVDWFWDEYIRCAPRAGTYPQWRPDTAEMRKDDKVHPELTIEPLDFWLTKLKRREEGLE